MNRTFLVLLLALFGIGQAVSQEYVPFVREGVKWVYTYKKKNELFIKHTYTLELKGDAEINGKCYKVMHKYAGEGINNENDTIPVYLREEGKIVYGIVPDGKTYTDCPVGVMKDLEMMEKIAAGEEFVLYDFNEPIKFVEKWDLELMTYWPVLIPDKITIAGNSVNRYISSLNVCFIEGIGYDGLQKAYPLGVQDYTQDHIALNEVLENGEVIYSSESKKPFRESIPQLVREGVQWVNERVVIDHGEETRYYYTYEFKGVRSQGNPICYRYMGEELDVNTAEVAAYSITPYESYTDYDYRFYHNNQMQEVMDQRRLMMPYDPISPAYPLYSFDCSNSDIIFNNGINYYIANQLDDVLNRENFIEVEPLEIEGKECRRFAYIGEDGEPLAYITEGIGFDSRDMGDLLTPFTRKPDPDAEHQEYWGLSHVIKDGEIIYKGMRYDAAMFEGIKGDVNGDGKVDISDATALIDLLLQDHAMFRSPCDLDGNGLLGINDLTGLIDLLLGGNE